MFTFLSKFLKVLRLSLICSFVIFTTPSGHKIFLEIGKVSVGLMINEYKCKGRGCGCDSALRCLTNCCCVVDEDDVQLSLIEPQEPSCCQAVSEAPIQANPNNLKILNSKCGAEELFVSQLRSGFIGPELPTPTFYYFPTSKASWLRQAGGFEYFYPLKLMKVPIA
jgi:hypothetical protein